MILQAHRGVSSDYPENTMPAFEAAKAEGYGVIELDPEITRDKKFVLLHDKTLNRTARTRDGEKLSEELRLAELDYEDAAAYDFGLFRGEEFRGTSLPLFEEVLAFARENKISLKIDNKHQKFDTPDHLTFYELIKPYQDVACLTFNNVDELKEAVNIFSDMHFHYDGAVTDEILDELSGILPKEKLTVWAPMENKSTSWVKVGFVTPELAEKIKKHARLGIWLLSTDEELDKAEALGAEIVETNGTLKPRMPYTLLADMHTHSEHSHDSVCKIEDMLLSHKERGTRIFAVTDHFDTASYNDYDVFTPIKKAHEDVDILRKKYPDMTILKGIEIGEGFWFSDVAGEAEKMLSYDVIIGSVHLVRHGELSYAYSKIDFSALSDEEIADYLDSYFDDIIEMLKSRDFDILAHLTCPLRYIVGKYKRRVDLVKYEAKIDEILTRVIASGKSLEVNTSSIDTLGDFMPGREILIKYRDMGGTLITLGSDAHTAENASFGLRGASRALKALGFDKIYYYKNRKPYSINI